MTYWLRSGAAFVAAFLAVIMALDSHQTAVQSGSRIFGLLSGLALAYCLLSGVRCTSDAVSEEKRAGTLGLLFLTDLRGYDIILGKLVVTSLDAAYGLIAVFPVLAIPLLLGSVTASEFWRMTLLLVNTLIFSLMCGLLVSTWGQEQRQVLLGTIFALLAITFGLPLVWKLIYWFVPSPFFNFLLLPSPAYAFRVVTDSAFRLATQEYRLAMLAIFLVSLTALVAASFLLPRVFSREWGQSTKIARGGWRFGNASARRALAKRHLFQQPFLWLLKRDLLPIYGSRCLALTLLGCVIVTPGLLHFGIRTEPFVVYGVFGLHCLFKFLVAVDAARRLNEDKRGGLLELLLSTPLPVGKILQAQLSSTRSLFLVPGVGLAGLNLMVFISAPNLMRELGLNFIGGIAALALDSYAVAWVAMVNAVRQPNYAAAVLRSLGAIVGPPWMVCFIFLFCARPNNSTVHVFFFWWFAGSALFDLTVAGWAKRLLRHQFRRWAANDREPPPLRLGPRFGQLSAAGHRN